jgi:Aldo/keto reductase family
VKVGGSRRDFIRRSLFGAAITGLLSRAASTSAKTESRRVDRRQFGGIGADVSILGPGLGAAFMDGYERNLDAGHALLESALALGINYWYTARSYGLSEGMIAPVLVRNRNRVSLANKSDARDYEGFKRDLDRSLQMLRTDHIDLSICTICTTYKLKFRGRGDQRSKLTVQKLICESVSDRRTRTLVEHSKNLRILLLVL